MKNFDSRTYSISDFVEWEKQGQLELNPRFQRRAVWTPKAKSFLMDTIIRGKPIPKFFIRQQINVTTKTSSRDVVDGQQRLRTILSFVKDGFTIAKSQNREFGGRPFSQLPPETQEQILSYELAVDLLINLPDPEVLDIFSRLNSYAIILNEQEKINANHFSAFKNLADAVGRDYNQFWSDSRIFTSDQIMRMLEVNLAADLLIALIEGVKSKKQIRRYYGDYEKTFEHDDIELRSKFDLVIAKIGEIFPEGLANTEFTRVHLFYSLFIAIAHSLHGLKGLEADRPSVASRADVLRARTNLDDIGALFVEGLDVKALERDQQQFLTDLRRATTDTVVRERRAKFLLALLGREV